MRTFKLTAIFMAAFAMMAWATTSCDDGSGGNLTGSAVYGKKISEINLGSNSLPSNFSWKTPDVEVGTVGAKNITAVNDNDEDDECEVSVTVGKAAAADLIVAATKTVEVVNTAAKTFDLSTLLKAGVNTTGLTYALGALTNTGNILAANPSLSGNTLSYQGANDGTATQVITITSANYETADVTISFHVSSTSKNLVQIACTGLTTTYNGQTKGVTCTAGAYGGELTYVYKLNSQTVASPKDAGTYNVTVSMPTNENYAADDFETTLTINKATGLASGRVINIPSESVLAGSYNLNAIGTYLGRSDYGTVAYSLGDITQGTQHLGTPAPAIGNDGVTLTYKGTGEGTVRIPITVTTQNYAAVTVTLTLRFTLEYVCNLTNTNEWDGSSNFCYSSIAHKNCINSNKFWDGNACQDTEEEAEGNCESSNKYFNALGCFANEAEAIKATLPVVAMAVSEIQSDADFLEDINSGFSVKTDNDGNFKSIEIPLSATGIDNATAAAIADYVENTIVSDIAEKLQTEVNPHIQVSIAKNNDGDDGWGNHFVAPRYTPPTTTTPGSYTYYLKVEINPFIYVGPFIVTIPPTGSSTELGCTSRCSGYVTTPVLSQAAIGNKAVQIANGLNLSVNSSAVVKVYGLKGNLVQSASYASGSHTVSLGTLPKGMYIVKVSFNGSESKVMKMAVK